MSDATESNEPAILVGGSVDDPTYRIGRMPSANQDLLSVKSETSLQEAITLMLLHNFSQLPVMHSEREVKGVVSWESIARRLALGHSCHNVRDCMEPHQEVQANSPLFATIGKIIEHNYVLVRNSHNKIIGIVTASDIALQFHRLGQPFLLLGEIENHIRAIIDKKFTHEELQGICDPNDSKRIVQNVADLTFGEYIRLFENPELWKRVELPIDRTIFVKHLDTIRVIRNNVMHFDPADPNDDDLEKLHNFVRFLRNLRDVRQA